MLHTFIELINTYLQAVSNIHVIRASVNEKDFRTWNFNSKVCLPKFIIINYKKI